MIHPMCQGLVPKFRDVEFKLNTKTFSLNAAVSSESRYKTGLYAGQWYNIFAVECTGGGGSLQKDKTYQCELFLYLKVWHCF